MGDDLFEEHRDLAAGDSISRKRVLEDVEACQSARETVNSVQSALFCASPLSEQLQDGDGCVESALLREGRLEPRQLAGVSSREAVPAILAAGGAAAVFGPPDAKKSDVDDAKWSSSSEKVSVFCVVNGRRMSQL